jgi:hypothetical protein
METGDRNYYIKAVVSTTRFYFAYIQPQNSVLCLGKLQSKKEKNKQPPDTVTSVMQYLTVADKNIKQRCAWSFIGLPFSSGDKFPTGRKITFNSDMMINCGIEVTIEILIPSRQWYQSRN